jgi:hypothetical protein
MRADFAPRGGIALSDHPSPAVPLVEPPPRAAGERIIWTPAGGRLTSSLQASSHDQTGRQLFSEHAAEIPGIASVLAI